MVSKKGSQALGTLAAVTLVLLLVVAACRDPTPNMGTSAAPTIEPATAPLDGWADLLRTMPYPYHRPLAPSKETILDGTYTKVDPRPGERAGCRRCPPYPPEGGVWKLALDKGTFHVMHERTEWGTLGSTVVVGDRIEFFNDPHCHEDVGIYRWRLEAGQLTLELIRDGCGVDLRAGCLAAQPWLACQPPSEEAAITDHWAKPPGCD